MKFYNKSKDEFSLLEEMPSFSEGLEGLRGIGLEDRYGDMIHEKDIVRFTECWSEVPEEGVVGIVYYHPGDLSFYFDVAGDLFHPRKEVVEGTIEKLGNACNMTITEAVVFDHWQKMDELRCKYCGWYGSPEELEVNVDRIPVCPDCNDDDGLYEVTRNMGEELI